MKTGIRYCAPELKIGFRGVSREIAVLIPLPGDKKSEDEIFLARGVDVPADKLPYLPDMTENSNFVKEGYWYHYAIKKSVFIIYLNEEGQYCEVLHVVLFKNEDTPRVLKDERKKLISKGVIISTDEEEINRILKEKEIVLN
jgi:hypothetical protein